MEKPSEKAVSDLEVSSYYDGYDWEIGLTWYYDSADPAEYLIVCKKDGYNTVENVTSGTLRNFKQMSYTDYQSSSGKYTYTVYTVGNGFSTSASKSVTVNCEYPTYNYPGNNSSSSGSGSLTSLSSTSWRNGSSYISFTSSTDATYYDGTNSSSCTYTYSSGSGELRVAGTSYAFATFSISGSELSFTVAGSPYTVTFYKN